MNYFHFEFDMKFSYVTHWLGNVFDLSKVIQVCGLWSFVWRHDLTWNHKTNHAATVINSIVKKVRKLSDRLYLSMLAEF